MDLKTRYVVKGIGKEQIIDSKILIFYDKATGKITKVQDKWNGKLPDSSFTTVSFGQLSSPWWWLHYYEGWAWWLWSFTWETWWWQVGAYSPTLSATSRTDSSQILIMAERRYVRYVDL